MKKLAYVAVFALPALALAQEGEGLTGVLATFGGLLNTAVGLMFALAVLAFFWGLALYIFKAGEDKQKGINIMIMGTIALFVMASVYGLIGLLQNSFGIDNDGSDINVSVPGIGGNAGSN